MSSPGSLWPDEPVLVEVTRSGVVESVHRGSVAGLGSDGEVALTLGSTDRPVFGRSSNKPLQATGMVSLGLSVRPALLAIVVASHSGSPRHLALVQELLASVGLGIDALRNTPALPLDERCAHDALRAGLQPTRLMQNCSGKHAGMLVTCALNGWPLASYLDSGHPLQQHLGATIAALAGEEPAAIGIDGCGAPVHALSLLGLARAYRRIALAGHDSPERHVADAIRAHPEVVGGEGRDVTDLLRAVPGLIAKDGAEGVYAAATPDGRAVALKLADGAARGRCAALLAALGALDVDVSAAAGLRSTTVLGGDRRVGEVRARRLT